jgi:arsenate reductase
MIKTKVLFLCSGNSARSQMAEAYLRYYAADYFEPYSAGLEPSEINPFTNKVMAEEGISLEGQYAKHVSLYMGNQHFGYLITVCSKADKNCPAVFPEYLSVCIGTLKTPLLFKERMKISYASFAK